MIWLWEAISTSKSLLFEIREDIVKSQKELDIYKEQVSDLRKVKTQLEIDILLLEKKRDEINK
jgi:hypothetical protein